MDTIDKRFNMREDNQEEVILEDNEVILDNDKEEAMREDNQTPDAANAFRDAAMAELSSVFEQRGHKPSDAFMDALSHIVGVIDRMSLGTMPDDNAVYLSTLAPGVGKSTALSAAIRQLVNKHPHTYGVMRKTNDLYESAGVLVILDRIEEIKNLVSSMQLSETDYAVLVSPQSLSVIGDKRGLTVLSQKDDGTSFIHEQGIKDARVLFTTKAQIDKLSKGGSIPFDDIVLLKWAYSYDEEAKERVYIPRRVRIRDEWLNPANALTLSSGKLLQIAGVCADAPYLFKVFESPEGQAFVDAVVKAVHELDDVELPDAEASVGATVDLPNPAHYGITRDDWITMFIRSPALQTSAEAFFDLMSYDEGGEGSGEALEDNPTKVVVAAKTFAVSEPISGGGGGFKREAIAFTNAIPEGLTPILVLDASGSFKDAYKHWEAKESKRRENLIRLPDVAKSYQGLTIHIDTGSGERGAVGKSWFTKSANQGEPYARLMATYADDFRHIIEAGEELLIITHKADDPETTRSRHTRVSAMPSIFEDLVAALEKLEGCEDARELMRLCTWGKHTAVNDYRSFKHVAILTQFYKPYHHTEALLRGARGMAPFDTIDKDLVKAYGYSELQHEVYQAATRIAIRALEGDRCPEGLHLYLKSGNNDDLFSSIGSLFPDCEVKRWHYAGNQDVHRAAKGLAKWAEDNQEVFGTTPKRFNRPDNDQEEVILEDNQAWIKTPDIVKALREAGVDKYANEEKKLRTRILKHKGLPLLLKEDNLEIDFIEGRRGAILRRTED